MTFQRKTSMGPLVFLTGLFCAHVLAQVPSVLRVPDGTALRLVLTQSLSSDTNEVDDPVYFEVIEDAKAFGMVVIPKGSTAAGHVVEVEPRKRMGRAGKLNFTVDYVKSPDGSNLRLRASSTRKGEDKTGTVIVGSVVFSPLFMIMRGKDITIPKGTQITAYVDGDREIGMETPSGAPMVQPVGVRAAGAEPMFRPAVIHSSEPVDLNNGTVSFRSSPDDADIIIDGKFLGTTPSTLKLEAGDHMVLIEKSHFESWKRVVTVNGGSQVTINPELAKAQ